MSQKTTVLNHLRTHGYITRVIANAVYGVGDLRKRVSELRAAGYRIETVTKTDDFGRRYSRYELLQLPATTSLAA